LKSMNNKIWKNILLIVMQVIEKRDRYFVV